MEHKTYIEEKCEEFEKQFYKGIDFADFELSEKEISICKMREEKHSFEEVGKEFGVTRERIRQIEAKVQEKIRQK